MTPSAGSGNSASASKSKDSIHQFDYQFLAANGGALNDSSATHNTSIKSCDKQLSTLDKLLERERTDLNQWRMHLSSFMLIVVAFAVQVLRGSKKAPSMVGIERCSSYDNVILGLFLSFTAYTIYYEVRRV